MLKLAVCALLVAVALGAEGEADDGGAPPAGHSLLDKKEKLLFGSYRTITRTGVTFTTSTVWATCLFDVDSGTACTRRRKKRTIEKADITDADVSELDGSIDEEGKAEDEAARERLTGIYTVWTTGTTSTTLTTFSTNTATTISLDYICTRQGVSYPATVCG